MRLTWVSILTLAVAVSAALMAQIPERAQWEITFSQVEAAAGLTDLATAGPETYEARIMQRPWSFEGPLAFLRLVRTNSAMRVQMFLFWAPARMAPSSRPTGSDIICRDGICVRPIGVGQQRDWGEVLESLAVQDACPQQGPPFGVCGDCDHVWIKSKANNKYREQSCNMPKPETPAGAVLLLMKTAADAPRRD